MSNFDHLIQLANRLGQVPSGSLLADLTIHNAINAEGEVLSYTSQEAVARLLLPNGFEWRDAVYSGGQAYASCRPTGRNGEFAHVGQWGKTAALAMCGTAMRVRAGLLKGAGS